MALDPDAIRRLATLSRLALTDDEVAGYSESLSDILTVLDRLKGLPVGDAAPLASPLALPQALRPDEARAVTNQEALRAGAPATDSGFFLVPKVLS
jgi:aspartyl-tRNA(Asn)/glutamyl-tRNA(Gln) amidotransferase subunit C